MTCFGPDPEWVEKGRSEQDNLEYSCPSQVPRLTFPIEDWVGEPDFSIPHFPEPKA